MKIGCHISITGGIFNAPERANKLGCEVMQIFTRSPQGGNVLEITPAIIKQFKENIKKFKIKNTYIHTPYYINFASANNRIRYGSVKTVREELERASLLGAKYVMTHLGSAKDSTLPEAIIKTTEMLAKTLKGYIGSAQLLLENSAGSGQIIGSNLYDLKTVINGVNSKSIAGICLDTQHSFASGYNWTKFDETLKKINKEIGLDKIRLIHANDSMTTLNSKKDRHEHIGKGFIGEKAFQDIVKFAKKNKIDMICETQDPERKEDIKLLKKLRDKK